MYWVIGALLSNVAFAMQDTITYRLTALKALNSFAVGAAMHIWFALIATVVIISVYVVSPKHAAPVFHGIGTLAHGHGPAVFLYSLLLFVANALLYEAYSLGARLNNTNPGVASSLSNMSLILSVGLPAWFLGKKLSLANTVGIIVYLAAAYMLVSNPAPPKEKTGASKLVETDTSGRLHLEWLACCLGSALLYGLATFCAFLIIRQSDIQSNAALTYSLFVTEAALGVALYLLLSYFPEVQGANAMLKDYSGDIVELFRVPKDVMGIVPASIMGGLGVTALYVGYLTAPNSGFVDAISNLYTATQSLIAWYIYGTALSEGQLVGLGLSGLSVGLLSV